MHVKFDFLDDSGCSIFDEKLKRAECILNTSPFFGFGVQFLPQLLHNDSTLLARGEFKKYSE